MKYFEIKRLIEAVEHKSGKKMNVAADFEKLATEIKIKCEEHLSPLALKRLWGFLANMEKPKRSTLDTLSLFVGYQDWESFKSALHGESDAQSNYGSCKVVSNTDLVNGDKLQLTWKPAGKCILKYIGENRFTVIFSGDNMLAEGDTFESSEFENGASLLVTDFVHNGQPSAPIMIGEIEGIRFVVNEK